MAVTRDGPEKKDKQGTEEHDVSGSGTERPARPFDSSKLRSIPAAGRDDPPYRYWWAVDDDGEPSAA